MSQGENIGYSIWRIFVILFVLVWPLVLWDVLRRR